MTDSSIGKIIGDRYYIESYIHEGSMSVVYGAVDITDNSRLVVKGCSNMDVAESNALINEYKILGMLNHCGIPKCYEYISCDGFDYIAMEGIDGHTLDYMMNNRRISIYDILSIATELCRILIYIHNLSPSVYHCDIKPSNIIIKNDGQVALIDFGISVCEEVAGPAFGTEGYAAPEQFEEHASIDARTDIYSVGMLIRYMLSDCREYALRKKLNRIIDCCTADNMYHRYSDVSEILTELMLISGEEGTVRLIYI